MKRLLGLHWQQLHPSRVENQQGQGEAWRGTWHHIPRLVLSLQPVCPMCRLHPPPVCWSASLAFPAPNLPKLVWPARYTLILPHYPCLSITAFVVANSKDKIRDLWWELRSLKMKLNLPFAIEVVEEEETREAMASGTKVRRQESEAWEWRLSLRGVDNWACSVAAIKASLLSLDCVILCVTVSSLIVWSREKGTTDVKHATSVTLDYGSACVQLSCHCARAWSLSWASSKLETCQVSNNY